MIDIHDCRWVAAELSDYLGGSLPAAARHELERHVVVCPPCRGNLAQMQTTLRVAARVEVGELSDETTGALNEMFRDWARRRGGR
jgi:anti-sigma factor RsiW